jgi:hypothetical protein
MDIAAVIEETATRPGLLPLKLKAAFDMSDCVQMDKKL